jgi:hypothetical protein
MLKIRYTTRRPPFVRKAENALKEAVARVIEEHRQSGQPLAIGKNGRVILVTPEKLAVKEFSAKYRVPQQSKPRSPK